MLFINAPTKHQNLNYSNTLTSRTSKRLSSHISPKKLSIPMRKTRLEEPECLPGHHWAGNRETSMVSLPGYLTSKLPHLRITTRIIELIKSSSINRVTIISLKAAQALHQASSLNKMHLRAQSQDPDASVVNLSLAAVS